MPDVDDPFEQARSQWLGGGEPFANALTQELFKKGFPVLGSVFSFWKSAQQKEVLVEFNNWVIDFLKLLDHRVDNLPEIMTAQLNRLAAVAVERILWGTSVGRAKQFAAILASRIPSPENMQAIEDAAHFIRVLDELSEDDLKVLKHLFVYQGRLVVEEHAMPEHTFFADGGMENMLNDARNLGLQMDEFYARCYRLGGYGLALQLRTHFGAGGGAIHFAFRITLLGKRLGELLIFASRL